MKDSGTRLPSIVTPAFEMAWCNGKQPFANRGEALRVVRERKRRGTCNRRGHLTPYRCPVCGHWHLGSK